MFAFAALLALTRSDLTLDLPEASGGAALTEVKTMGEPLQPPKLSPRPIDGVKAEFLWETDGLVRSDASDPFEPRFHVYSQVRRDSDDLAPAVARMLVRLWQQVHKRWRYDNPRDYENGTVDVYLCEGGRPGGEQYLGFEYPGSGQGHSVNVICVYDVKSFAKPIEMAREVAHEYGHAVLPGINGFKQPEDWANGYLGERLFLRWFRDVMAGKQLEPADAMGASADELDRLIKLRVDPLVLAAASAPPNLSVLHKTGPEAMAAYHGLVLYVDSILPRTVAGRSMRLVGTTHAWDYPHAIVMAEQELDRFTMNIPPLLKGTPLWIPLGKGKLSGAQILKRQGEWVQIAPPTGQVTVIPAEPGS